MTLDPSTVSLRTARVVVLLLLGACAQEEQPAPAADNLARSHGDADVSSPVDADAVTLADYGSFTVMVPDAWIASTPRSTMRKAQYALPRSGSDPEDGELVVYYFGKGEGGSVDANVERWIGQFGQPDGSSSADQATRTTREVSGLKVTVVDVTGTYQAPVTPMSSQRHNKPGFRMLAAIIETGDGPYFLKLTGPGQTIGRWERAFDAYVNSISVR